MIRKLRLKFIASALASVLITLVLLMGAINIYNYRTIAHNADQILYILKENHGVFPDLDDPLEPCINPMIILKKQGLSQGILWLKWIPMVRFL